MAAFSTVFDKMLAGEAETGAVTTTPGQFTLKLLLTNGQVGALMGKGGTAIQSIRDTTGANIRVASQKEMPFGVCPLLPTCRALPCVRVCARVCVSTSVCDPAVSRAADVDSGRAGVRPRRVPHAVCGDRELAVPRRRRKRHKPRRQCRRASHALARYLLGADTHSRHRIRAHTLLPVLRDTRPPGPHGGHLTLPRS